MATQLSLARTANVVPALHPTRCAICDTLDHATELYPANFALEAFRPAIFSARRLPDRFHYRMVRCRQCGLVRSDPVADEGTLRSLYARSSFDYGAEVATLLETYGRYLEKSRSFAAGWQRLLEIGCGNGFFLEEALARGVPEVHGIEPSTSAVASASPRVRPNIVTDVFRPGLFPAASFDIICMFQVLDHLPFPREVLDECWHVLKPGGILLCLQHNVTALSARLLGRRSPIIDIEHTYLYSPETLRRLFIGAGFEVVAAGPARNSCRLDYLLHLLPLPGSLKRAVRAAARWTRLADRTLTLPLGNWYQIARRAYHDRVET